MRKLVLSTLLLASVFQTVFGEQSGDWTYSVSNNQAVIVGYSGLGGAITIPTTLGGYPVTSIGEANGYQIPFSPGGIPNTSVTSVIIPYGVTSIGYGAFYNCTRLTEVTIPSSVTSIGDSGFEKTSLANVVIPESVTTIGSGAFGACTSLTVINIPNRVTTIGGNAFSNCSSLVKATIGYGVTSIGDYAFYNCSKLSKVIFYGNPPSVPRAGQYVFYNTPSTIYYLLGATGWGSSFAYRPAKLGTYFLSAVPNAGKGTIRIEPLKESYTMDESVSLTVAPNSGYLFSFWSGDSGGSASSISLSMNSDKVLTANFIQDNADSDGDGLTNYQESVTYGTNPNQKDSNADGVEDGHAVSMGYSPTLNFSALLAHPPTGLYTATQMQAMAIGDLVLTKNANGSFTLNYDIEQSADLQTWTTYAPLSLPLTGLPTDKAFVRIKAKQ